MQGMCKYLYLLIILIIVSYHINNEGAVNVEVHLCSLQ